MENLKTKQNMKNSKIESKNRVREEQVTNSPKAIGKCKIIPVQCYPKEMNNADSRN